MEKLKQLLAKMRKAQEAMEELQGKISSETDQAKQNAYKSLFIEKQVEFDQLKTELENAKTMADMKKTIKDAEDLAKVDEPSGDLGDDGKTSKEKTKEKKEHVEFKTDGQRELAKSTMDFLSGEKEIADLPEGAKEVLRVPDSIMCRAEKVHPKLTVMLPQNMCAKILNPVYGAKVLLSTDDNTSHVSWPTNILQAPDFRAQLLSKPIFEPTLYDRVRVIPAVNGKAGWPKLDQTAGKKFGGVAFTWKSTEGADKGETEPVFTDFEITTSELSGWTELSITMLNRSAIQLETLLTDLFQRAARYEFSRTILIGSGTNQPLGIKQGVNLVVKSRDVAGQVSPKDLNRLIYGISKGERAGASYIMDDTVEAYLVDLQDGMERPLFRASMTDGPADRITGYSYETHEHGPALGTKGDVIFGNPQQYAFAIEEQIAIARSDHAEFKKGRVVFRMITFVGGKPIYDDSFVALA